MFIDTEGRSINVQFGPQDAPETRQRIARALNLCCEGEVKLSDADGLVVEVATNASTEGARALIDLAVQPHEVPISPTLAEEAHGNIIMPDGLPFVINAR